MPLPSTAKGEATRRRILDAAAEEFAARGIAGARIERVTAAARTNKAQLYGYFGSKDGLFDAVIADLVDRLASAGPFDGEDLPGFAVSLYDDTVAHPELIRLATWTRLERQPEGMLFAGADRTSKLDGIAAAQAAGKVVAGDPAEVFSLVVAAASAWSASSLAFAAGRSDSAAAHARRRELLREWVARAVTP